MGLFTSSSILTASADIDVQVAFDESAALQGLGSIHRVDGFNITDLITEAVTCATEHTVQGE